MTERPEPPRVVRLILHVRDAYVPWVETHLLIISMAALGVAALYAAYHAHRRRRRRARPERVARRHRIRSARLTAAQRNLTTKLRGRVGHEDDAVDFIDWPNDVKATGAVLVIRHSERWSAIGPQLNLIHAQVEQMLGGQWKADHDYGHNKLRFTRQAPPFTLPIKLAYRDLDRDPERVTLGVRDDGAPCRWDLTFPEYAHALVVGMTGSGKSNALRLIIVELAQLGALIDILDAKGGEDFEDFAEHPGIRVWTEPVDQIRVLFEFKSDMESRQTTRGVVRTRLPHRVLLIDETAELRPALSPFFRGEEYAAVLLSIARLARSVHMHLVFATQKPTAKALTGNATSGGELRDMFGFRLGLGRLSRSASGMTFDDDAPPVAAVTGRGVTQVNGEFTQVQTAKLDLVDAVKVAARGDARFDTVTIETGGDPSRTLARAGVDPQLHGVTTVTTLEPVTLDAIPTLVVLTCLKCKTSQETTAAAGTLVRCKNPDCRHPRRIPMSARSS